MTADKETTDGLSISSGDPSYWANWELGRGNPVPASEILACGEVHPLLMRELAKLLAGDHPSLVIKPRPNKKGRQKQRGATEARFDQRLVAFIEAEQKKAHQAGARRLKLEIYRAATNAFGREAEELGIGRLSQSYIEHAIKRVRDGNDRLRRFMAAHSASK